MNISRIKKITFIMLVFTLIFFVGCSTEENYEGQTKIIFELEGGVFQNCTLPVTRYYDFQETTNNLIHEPGYFSRAQVTRSGYVLEGWYLEKNISGEEVTYTDKWDFETDRVEGSELTLYAHWERDYKFTYVVCYYDDNNQEQTLGSYTVRAGAKFDDFASYASKRIGYTAISYQDSEGNPWNDDYTHPGGESDVAVKVFVEYIEGTYAVVTNANELKANKNRNIYLLNDIDLEGTAFNFNDYRGTFLGNNHTISNFTINYSASRNDLIDDYLDSNEKSLSISLFGNTNGAVIKDVIFSNVSVDVRTSLTTTHRIYVAPLAGSMTNTTISNVSFQGKYTITQLPNNFNQEEDLILVTDRLYCYSDDESTVTEFNVNIEKE